MSAVPFVLAPGTRGRRGEKTALLAAARPIWCVCGQPRSERSKSLAITSSVAALVMKGTLVPHSRTPPSQIPSKVPEAIRGCEPSRRLQETAEHKAMQGNATGPDDFAAIRNGECFVSVEKRKNRKCAFAQSILSMELLCCTVCLPRPSCTSQQHTDSHLESLHPALRVGRIP